MRRIISLALALATAGLAMGPVATLKRSVPQPGGERLLSEISNVPAMGWMVWWTGAGKVGDFVVANAMQGGIFSRAATDNRLYDGIFPTASVDLDRGKTCEYPKGLKQYYLYANGFWFGAIYPDTRTLDTVWKPNVSKAAYNSDMGAMSVPEMNAAGSMGDISGIGLFFSDMVIPEGYSGAGDFLFAKPGESPQAYQELWPFADTALNSKRPAGQKLNPAAGDVVSHEDTYAVGGDWIPDSNAAVIWILDTGNYDSLGLGIRIEQRTYSWSTSALANAIVLNYKIRNMNSFTLKTPYFSYFLDPDLGTGGSKPGDDGGWDDLTGFDKPRNMGYTYDENGSEQGWTQAPGYIGAVLLETPGNKGMTGFNCWTNDSVMIVDNLGQDSAKYAYMTSTNFIAINDPNDVRMMLNSGPYANLAPNKEYNFTVAVVLGNDLNDLKANVDSVKAAFDAGFPSVGVLEDRTGEIPPLKLSLAGTVSGGGIKLSYSLPSSGDVSISLFDASGRKLSTLRQGREQAGAHELSIGKAGFASGVYFVRLATAAGSATAKMLVID